MFRMLMMGAAIAALGACAADSGPPATATPASTAAPAAALSPADAPKVTAYLDPAAIDGRVILSPPPTPDSPHGLADRAVYDQTRALKDTPRWRTAIQDNDLWTGGALKRFSCALGADLSEKGTPAAWKLLHRIEYDVRNIGTPAKDHFARKRPALGNDKPICVPREKWLETNASYPSGHAMVAWAWALILTEAKPDRANALLRVGQDSGDSRVVCGVHFPSDVEAGRTLSAGMVARLHADPGFMADLAALKRELAAAPAPANCPAN